MCYILGANPPQNMMEGFIHRIWGKFGVDKVSLAGRGIFLVRFKTMENCDNVLKGGPYFFDSKPMYCKAWTPSVDYTKEPVQVVPLWIKLTGLNVKYWGERSLFKIAGMIGKAIKVDQATLNRDKLMFAKVLVEINMGQGCPKVLQFINEEGVQIEQSVEYEWLPTVCSVCKGMGHVSDQCKRKHPPKQKKSLGEEEQPTH